MKKTIRIITFWLLYLLTLPRSYRFYFFFGKRCLILSKEFKFLTLNLANFEDRFTVLDIFSKQSYGQKPLQKFIFLRNKNIQLFDFGANIGCSSLFFLETYENLKLFADPNV